MNAHFARLARIVVPGLAATLWTGAALAASPFDGTYHGTSARIQGRDGTCSKDHRQTVQVVDGAFDVKWSSSQGVEIHITIAEDGTVGGTRAWGRGSRVSASGTARPGALEIDLKGVECVRHLSLKRG